MIFLTPRPPYRLAVFAYKNAREKNMKITIAILSGIILTIPQAYASPSVCTETNVPIIPSSAWAGLGSGCPNGTGGGGYTTTLNNCSAFAYKCYKNTTGETYFITTCTTCDSGYELSDATFSGGATCSNTMKYQKCTKESGGGDGPVTGNCTVDNCTKKSGWEAHATGYEVLNYYSCVNDVCTPTPQQYRCAKYYYGTSTNGTTGCNRCPLSGTGNPEPGDSIPGSNTKLSDCYLRSGRSGADDSGTFTVSGDCYHD